MLLGYLLLIVTLSGIFAFLGAMSGQVTLWHRLGAACMGMAFAQAAIVPALIAAAFSLGLLSPVFYFALMGVPYYVANAFVNPEAYQQEFRDEDNVQTPSGASPDRFNGSKFPTRPVSDS